MALLAARAVERDARVYRSLWLGNFFSAFIAPVLYLGALGVGLGGMVDAYSGGVDGLPYLQFIVPGVIAAQALHLAADESLWPVMGGFKWFGHYHAMVAAPLRPFDVYLGALGWQACRLSLHAAFFVAVAALLGGIASPGAVLAVPASALTGVAFAAPTMAFSATQDSDAMFSLIMRLVVLPLFLFSGTFFPVSQLPSPIDRLVVVSPLWHGVELCRAATTGRWAEAGAGVIAGHILVLVAFVVVGAVLGARTFTRRLTP